MRRRQPPHRRLTGAALALALGASAAAGCGTADRQPTTRGAADATFTVPESERPEAKATCPQAGRPALSAKAQRVRVADVVEKRGPATRVLDTAQDLQLQCLRWSSWGGRQATAHGVAHLLVCQPTCAEGTQQEIEATVVLSSLKTCGKRRWYAKAAVTLDRKGVKPPASYLRPPC
jgi:hypothetical protein